MSANASLIQIHCVSCGAELEVPDSIVGKLTKCSACESVFQVEGLCELPSDEPTVPLIRVKCASCRVKLNVPDSAVGEMTTCPTCDATFRVKRPASPLRKVLHVCLILELVLAIPVVGLYILRDRENEWHLVRAAVGGKHQDQRLAAVEKMTLIKALTDTAKGADDADVCLAALEKLLDPQVLLDIGRNAKNARARLAAAGKMGPQYQAEAWEVFAEVALHGNAPDDRRAAVEQLLDPKVIARVAREDVESKVRLAAVEKLTSQVELAQIAETDDDPGVQLAAVEQLTDQKALARIAESDGGSAVCLSAVKRLDDQDALARVAQKKGESSVQQAAIGRLDNNAVLADIAKNDGDSSVCLVAVERLSVLSAPGQLAEVAKTAKDMAVCEAAVEKLNQLNAQEALADVALRAEKPGVRRKAIGLVEDWAAFDGVTDQMEFAAVVLNTPNPAIRQAAFNELISQEAFLHVANNSVEPDIRQAAVEQLTDQDVLAGFAKNDKDQNVRLVVVKRLTEQEMLVSIALDDDDEYVRRAAVENKNLTNPSKLANLAINADNEDVCRLAMVKLDEDSPLLADVAKSKKHVNVCQAALERIDDPTTVVEVMKNAHFERIREKAAIRIVDLAKSDKGLDVCRMALKELDDPDTLADIAQTAKRTEIRLEAATRLLGTQHEEKVQAIFAEIAKNADADLEIRLGAIKLLTIPSELALVVIHDNNGDVWQAAIGRLDDQPELENIANNAKKNTEARLTAAERLDDKKVAQAVFSDIAKNRKALSDHRVKAIVQLLGDQQAIFVSLAKTDTDKDVLDAVFKKLDDPSLIDVAHNAEEWETRLTATKKLKDQKDIAQAAKDKNPTVRKEAVGRLENPKELAHVAKTDSDSGIRELALQNLRDQDFLVDVAENARNVDIQLVAAERLDKEHQKEAQAVFATLAKDAKAPVAHRKKAIGKLDNNSPAIVDIIKSQQDDAGVRLAAATKLNAWNRSDVQSMCVEIAKTSENREHRQAASMRIAAPKMREEVARILTERGQGLVPPDAAKAAGLYEEAAELGHAPAQYHLGRCYADLNGKSGVVWDDKKAVGLFMQAAAQKNVDAWFELAQCYEKGRGVTKDIQQAIEWYKKAADKNHREAQFALAQCYDTGGGVQNPKEAAKWYLKAAEQGHIRAQYELAQCYETGKGVSENRDKAIHWYTQFVRQKDADPKDIIEAEAQYRLGSCYADRNSRSKSDDVSAAEWFRRAADRPIEHNPQNKQVYGNEDRIDYGHPGAQYRLGMCYQMGYGVPKNPQEAKKWQERAEKNSH